MLMWLWVPKNRENRAKMVILNVLYGEAKQRALDGIGDLG